MAPRVGGVSLRGRAGLARRREFSEAAVVQRRSQRRGIGWRSKKSSIISDAETSVAVSPNAGIGTARATCARRRPPCRAEPPPRRGTRPSGRSGRVHAAKLRRRRAAPVARRPPRIVSATGGEAREPAALVRHQRVERPVKLEHRHRPRRRARRHPTTPATGATAAIRSESSHARRCERSPVGEPRREHARRIDTVLRRHGVDQRADEADVVDGAGHREAAALAGVPARVEAVGRGDDEVARASASAGMLA